MRQYKRKTNRGRTPDDILERAAKEVANGKSIRSVGIDFKIDRMTLKRYILKKAENPQAVTGYKATALAHAIFTEDMECDLASHVKQMADMFHGLSLKKCCILAYEFGSQNQIKMPANWITNGRAGHDWWKGFKARHHLAIRSPEATSFARAAAFNEQMVKKFYDNLALVLDKYKFQPSEIFNCDETGCTTVQKPRDIITEKGRKQVGSITSAERGELVTVVYTVSAVGNVLPPMFIFPRVHYRDHFINGSPSGSIGRATKTGWINESLFLDYINHIVKHTRCSPDKKILLIYDNHESHISLKTIDLARENGIILLTIPPHTSHRLQPLDRSVYGPFKSSFNRAMDGWLRSNPGKTVTIYELPQLVNEAHMAAMTPRNILSGFKNTGIFPFNRALFSDSDFAPSSTTDQMLEEGNSSKGNQLDEDNRPSGSGTDLNPRNSSTSTGDSEGYVSPSAILPLPKAGPRKKTTRKRGTTQILTDTPTRNTIAAFLQQAKSKNPKMKKSLFSDKTKMVKEIQSSSSESEMEYSDFSEDEVFEEDGEIIEGDFVVVRVAGKLRSVNYIARIDVLNGVDYEGIFLQKVSGKVDSEETIFVPKEDDEACFPKEDIIFKLPKPNIVGGSARRSCQLVFKCNLTKFNLVY